MNYVWDSSSSLSTFRDYIVETRFLFVFFLLDLVWSFVRSDAGFKKDEYFYTAQRRNRSLIKEGNRTKHPQTAAPDHHLKFSFFLRPHFFALFCHAITGQWMEIGELEYVLLFCFRPPPRVEWRVNDSFLVSYSLFHPIHRHDRRHHQDPREIYSH